MDTAVMKKTNEIAKLLVSELMPKRIIDNNAQTIEEVAEASGISPSTAKRQIDQLLKANKIERVWKQGKRHLVPAYRTL